VMCETIFNQHPGVKRTAVVGVGPEENQLPILVVEPLAEAVPTTLSDRRRFTLELLALGAVHEHTRGIEHVLFYPAIFPTDVRHNVKIQREKLAVWAAAQIRGTATAKGSSRRPGLAPDGSPRRVGDLLKLAGVVAGLGIAFWMLLRRPSREE